VLHLETRYKTNYRAIVLTPTQTFNILKSLTNNLHHALVLTCGATALRPSEILALRWADILWLEEGIRLSKRWVKGIDGETKAEAADGYVPLQIQSWRTIYGGGATSHPYKKDKGFVFRSLKAHGRVPLSSSVFVAEHLRPAVRAVG
jgi:integrase